MHWMHDNLVYSALRVAAMLERLSADSIWAHRASGVRGSLLETLDRIEDGQASNKDVSELERLVTEGFDILEKAAREIHAR
jgi:hypothetical protein